MSHNPHTNEAGVKSCAVNMTHDTRVGQLLHIAVDAYTMQLGGVLEFNGSMETSHGPYAIHIHVCVEPLKRGPVN